MQHLGFSDQFSQATLFFNSQSPAGQQHIIDAFSFELGKVNYMYIRERVLSLFTQVDRSLAHSVADNLGIDMPKPPVKTMNEGVPADADRRQYEPKKSRRSRDIYSGLVSRPVSCLRKWILEKSRIHGVISGVE